MKPEIAFAGRALVARVAGFAAGRQSAQERAVKLPPPVQAIPRSKSAPSVSDWAARKPSLPRCSTCRR